VFDVDGTLYVVDNAVDDDGNSTSQILRVAPDGTATPLPVSASQLGRPDGIEIDEGMNRLLVTSLTAGGEQLIAVNPSTGAVTALGNVDFDGGFFPTGVVYDRLGAVVLRQGDNSSSLKVVPLAPP